MQCPVCLFENELSAMSCGVCGAVLTSLPPVPTSGASRAPSAPAAPAVPVGAALSPPDATVLSSTCDEEFEAVVVVYTAAEPRGALVRLRTGRNAVGRRPGADVVVADPRASADHAWLFVTAVDRASWVDTSRNGSMVDGQPVMGSAVELRHGSTVRIGDAWIVLSFLASRHPA